MDDLSGKIIKDNELRERIGAGGFGAVYRAYQPSVGREVAVKVILPQHAAQPEFIRRFESEARTVARLEHPHIVPLYNYWRDETGAYLVMRWLRGGSLPALLEGGPLPLETALRLFSQISEALATAHGQNVVHRDLKPDNILLDEQGNAYLSDFGIAIEVSSVENVRSDVMIGSVAYISPEQIRGEPVTPQADIYSLGILLYELLTGEHPFADLTPADMLHRHLGQPLPSVRARRADLPEGVDEVVQKATAKRPDDRYLNVSLFAAALETQLQAAETVGRDIKARVYDSADAIPNQPLRLIGREATLAAIETALENDKRVLLSGFGGMGKTSLAATTAAAHIETGKGSVIWLEAGGQDADALLEAIGRGFGEGQTVASSDDPMTAVRQLLETKQALLVLDNVWNDAALFQVLKAVPRAMPVLVTSRHAIPMEGARVEVGGLEAARSLELLGHYAGASFADGKTANDAAALCRQLGYHPFALEIAGKTLKADRHLTPARLLRRIADAPHLLHVPGNFADMGRESVKGLLDTSVDELSPEARRVFTAMGGLFAPRATLALLAGAMGAEVSAVETTLADLQQRGLAELLYGGEEDEDAEPDHYRLHDLTYSYARALFKAGSRDHRTTVAAVIGYIEAHQDDYDALDFEQNHLLEAAWTAHEEGDGDSLIDIMTRLNVSGNYFAARGQTARSLELLKLAISAATARGDITTAHYFWSKLGNTYANYLSNLDKAFEAYHEAVRLAVLMGDTRRQALLLGVIGNMRSRELSTDADGYLLAAYSLAKKNSDDVALSQILEWMGHQAATNKDYVFARKYYNESLEVAERLKNHERLFYALTCLGEIERALNNFAVALTLNQRAYRIAEAEDYRLWMAYSLENIGDSYHGLHASEQAKSCFTEALTLYRQVEASVEVERLSKSMYTNGYDLT